MCQSHNSSKGSKGADEWLQEQYPDLNIQIKAKDSLETEFTYTQAEFLLKASSVLITARKPFDELTDVLKHLYNPRKPFIRDHSFISRDNIMFIKKTRDKYFSHGHLSLDDPNREEDLKSAINLMKLIINK